MALLMGSALASAPAAEPGDRPDFSAAETLLFMSNHLSGIRPPQTIGYALRKSGSLEAGFDDRIVMHFAAQADGRCCDVRSEFLSGPRHKALPVVAAAQGNPLILHLLERDIAEMRRLTGGSLNHFRQRIRLAVARAATLGDTSFVYQGQPLVASEVGWWPYLDDPNRPKYAALARKRYVFWLSPAVPGGVVGLRTHIEAADDVTGATPLIAEELLIDGATMSLPPPPAP